MHPWHFDDRATIYHGDCIEVLRGLPDASVDSVVTDPPYALNFMGKEWDNFKRHTTGACEECGGDDPAEGLTVCIECAVRLDEQRLRNASMLGHQSQNWTKKETHSRGYADNNNGAFQRWCELWVAECLRVLKPGGHLLAFGGTRTWHRLAVAVEDAGFEVRDSIAWLYGSGFPKSLDVSKAIDKAAGAERRVIGRATSWNRPDSEAGHAARMNVSPGEYDLTAPATPNAARWQGWGTALKPAFEPIVVARKPLTGTVAANVLEHGTGGLNIDGCRIGTEVIVNQPGGIPNGAGNYVGTTKARDRTVPPTTVAGRWPANVVLDEDQADALDKQSGERPPGSFPRPTSGKHDASAYSIGNNYSPARRMGDSGGASRFFYVAKAPARERPKADGIAHPTVKPLTLMRWLCRLVTPPGGVILEPFAGSGTTIEAALLEGFRVIAIERETDYLPLIQARLDRVAEDTDGQLPLDASA